MVNKAFRKQCYRSTPFQNKRYWGACAVPPNVSPVPTLNTAADSFNTVETVNCGAMTLGCQNKV